MAELRGGTTIGGYTALHSGLKEAYISGNLTMGGRITIPAGGQLMSAYNNAHIFKDFNNGNVTISAAGGQLYLGYQNTTGVRLSANLYGSNGTTLVADTTGKLFYQGSDADARWLTLSSNPYISTDLTGSSTYPRMAVKNSGATDSEWLRVGTSDGGHGLLPYLDGNSYIGTSSWRFKEIHAVNFYENGTLLSSKYAASGHNHDSTYVNVAGDTMSGDLIFSSQNQGIKLAQTSGTPTSKTSESWVTAGKDAGDLTAINNVAVQTWFGFSVSPTISGQTIAQGTPAFSVNARTGETRSAGRIYANAGLDISGSTNVTGDIILNDTSERAIKATSLNTGMYMNSSSIGIYDWKNARSVYSYNQTNNTITLGVPTVLNSATTINGTVTLNNNTLSGVTYLEGQYGNIAASYDEWLRINSGNTHTAGVYTGTTVLRTDGELQVGGAGANFKASATGLTVANSNAMSMRLVGTENTNNQNYVGFYQLNNTTRQGWMGFGGSTSNQFSVYNDGGNISLVPGGTTNGKVIITNTLNLEIGATKYYNGTASGGDSIYNPTGQVIIGGNTNVALWAETGSIVFRFGAVSASTVGLTMTATQTTIQGSLLIDNSADVDGTDDQGLTLRDSADNVISFDPNEMWIVNAANTRLSYTFNADYLNLTTASGTKRIPRVSWGTGAPPTTNVMDGDIYIQY